MLVDHKALAEFGELFDAVREEAAGCSWNGGLSQDGVVRIMKLAVREWFARVKATKDERDRLCCLEDKTAAEQ